MPPKLKKTRYPNIKKDPEGRFWVDVTIRGKRQRKMCADLDTARDYLASLRHTDRRAELFPEEAMRSKKQGLSLADLAAHFREEEEEKLALKTF